MCCAFRVFVENRYYAIREDGFFLTTNSKKFTLRALRESRGTLMDSVNYEHS